MKRFLSTLVPLAILALSALFNGLDPAWLQLTRLHVFDVLQQEFPRQYQPVPVKIVDIDDESLGRLGQWPWPRHLLAQMIAKLNEGGAAAIALDITFPEADRSSPAKFLRDWQPGQLDWQALAAKAPDYDREFAEAVKAANVVTGFVLTGNAKEQPAAKAGFAVMGDDPLPRLTPYPGAVVSLPGLTESAKGNGALNSVTDADGLIRRMPLAFRAGDALVPGLSAEAMRVAQGAGSYAVKTEGGAITAIRIGQLTVPTEADGSFALHYTRYSPDRYLPAWKLLAGQADPAALDGAIILVGTSAAGLKDIRATPLDPLTSGVEIHAQSIEQAMLGDFLKRPEWMRGAELIAMLTVGLLLILLMQRSNALLGALFALICFAAAAAASVIGYTRFQLLIDPLTPSIAIFLVYLVESLRRYVSTEKEKRQIRHAFSHYMSPALVERLAEHPESLKLGGEMREMSVLFCDIRGFTAISERYDAEALTRFINGFLTPMTDIILSHQGTIDKYMGDCIMAFWNAPLDDPGHASHALQAALSMLEGLRELNDKRADEALSKSTPFLPVEIGIGINTGLCCVGNMGSAQRFDYSVLGDDVNLASRLEGQSKQYGVTTVIGPRTREMAAGMATIELDLIRVKGKSGAVRIYGLLGDESLAATPVFQKLSAAVDAMLGAYRSQDWEAALASLEEGRAVAGSIRPNWLAAFFAFYAGRIADYQANPPAVEWDGVFTALSK